MKLPDFANFAPFQTLHKQMGVTQLADFNVQVDQSVSALLEQLRTGVVEIESLDDVRVHSDGTLLDKKTGERIILYIMDIGSYQRQTIRKYFNYRQSTDSLPKFHLADCRTFRDMRNKGRKERYVKSQKTDGWFEIKRSGYESEEGLDVCKNCLSKLNYNDYPRHKDKVFDQFSLGEFFEQYPKSPLKDTPKPQYTSDTAPIGYTDDWDEISRKYREGQDWICEECGDDMSNDRLNLHVHHINGVKYDNRPESLRVLCIQCHANQPGHGHMKKNLNY